VSKIVGTGLGFIEVLLKLLAIAVPLLISVAYFTLAERKLMAGMHRRRGPNVVGFLGLLQPLADGLKLFVKESIIPSNSNYVLFILSPMVTFILSIVGWGVIPFGFGRVLSDVNLGLLYIFMISSLGVYGIICAGWASNSKYAFLGALRSSAQMISYEIVLGTIFLCISFSVGSLNFLDIIYAQTIIWFIFPFFLLFLLFLITILAETNRIPFDLPEAESELVAGYNIEYSAIAFALFFLAEYSTMILFSVLGALLFFGGNLPFLNFFGLFLYIIKILVFTIFFVLIRGTLPRLRYDQLLFNN
jgi:NADH-quinone oxidoreductase subunit H